MNITYVTAGDIPSNAGLYQGQVLDVLDNLNRSSKTDEVRLISVVPVANRKSLDPKRLIADLTEVKRTSKLKSVSFFPALCLPKPFMYPANRWQDGVAISANTYIADILQRHPEPHIFHCRGYTAARIALQWKERKFPNAAVIFDARSHGPEEGAIRRGWKLDSSEYRHSKTKELELLKECDLTLGLSKTMSDYFAAIGARRTDTVTTVVRVDNETPLENRAVALKFCYAGLLHPATWHTPGSLWKVFDAVLRHQPGATLTVITRGDRQELLNDAKSTLKARADRIKVVSAPNPAQTMEIMRRHDVGIQTLAEPANSGEKLFTSSVIGTKVAEYLAAGLPVLVSAQCEAASQLVSSNQLGVVIGQGGLDERSIVRLNQLCGERDRIRSEATRLFGIEGRVAAYLNAYSRLRG